MGGEKGCVGEWERMDMGSQEEGWEKKTNLYSTSTQKGWILARLRGDLSHNRASMPT